MKSTLIRSAFLFFASCGIFFVPPVAHAGWAQMESPVYGSVNALAVSGSNIFAGATSNGQFIQNDGLYLSNNNGASWFPIISRLGSFLTVHALAASGNNVFASTTGSGEQIWRSTDGGTTWTTVLPGPPNYITNALAISNAYVFAGTAGGGVWFSTNNGTTWSAANTGLTNQTVTSLSVFGANIYAGTTGGGVFYSAIGGTLSWTAANTGLTNLNVTSFAVSGSNLFAGTAGGGVYISANGTSWSTVNTGLGNLNITTLTIFETAIFAATNAGVYYSNNGGTNWNADLTLTNSVTAFAVSGTNLFAGTARGIFLSTDNGTSWNVANTGLSSLLIQNRSFAISNSNFLVGTAQGVYLANQSGSVWSFLNSLITPSYYLGSEPFAVSGVNLFAGTNTGVFLSANGGQSFQQAGLSGNYISSLALSGTNLFAGISSGGGVYLSTNNGTGWNAVNTGLTNENVLSLAVVGANVFAGTRNNGTSGGVYLSTNNGTSWSAAGLTQFDIGLLAVSGTNLFALMDGHGVYLSTNNGTSWSSQNYNGLADSNIISVTVSGANVFVGTTRSGVFLTTNNGTTWSSLGSGLPKTNGVYGDSVDALILNGGYIYAGMNNPDGIWRRPLSDSGIVLSTGLVSLSTPNIGFSHRGIIHQHKDTVTIHNHGTITLIIDSIVSTDPLVTISDPDTLLAGDSVKITITSTDTSGATTAYILITTSDLVHPVDTITVNLNVPSSAIALSSDTITADVSLHPKTFIDTLIISNTGTALLTIDSVRSSNALITLNAPASIAAGNTGKLIATCNDSLLQSGMEHLLIYSNDPAYPVDSILVIIKGWFATIALSTDSIIVDKSLHPKTFVDTLDITNTGAATLRIDSIHSTNALITATWPDSVIAGGAGKLIVTCNDSLLQAGTAYLFVTSSDPIHPVDSIKISIHAPSVSFSLDSIVFSLKELSVADTITMRNSGNATLIIYSIVSNDPSVLISDPDTLAAGQTLQVVISLKDSAHIGNVAYLLISTNDPVRPVDSVKILISVPVVVVSADSIAFSKAKNLLSDTVAIHNTGTATLIIKSIVSTDPFITVSELDSVLAGASDKIIITSADTSKTTTTAFLVITTNDMLHPVDTIVVSIEGATAVAEITNPESFGLLQNYPNPFSGTTAITFSLLHSQNVSLRVYNALGSEVAELTRGVLDAGVHSLTFDAAHLPEGVYYYRLTANGVARAKPMMIVK